MEEIPLFQEVHLIVLLAGFFLSLHPVVSDLKLDESFSVNALDAKSYHEAEAGEQVPPPYSIYSYSDGLLIYL